MRERIDIEGSDSTLPFGKDRIFLIDSENTGWNGVAGYNMLKGDDQIYYFVTPNNVKEHIAVTVEEFFELKDELPKFTEILVEVDGTKNFLDDCIKTTIGYLLEKNIDREVVIISKDKGYKATKKFWEARGRIVKQAETIKAYLKPATVKISEKAQEEDMIARSLDEDFFPNPEEVPSKPKKVKSKQKKEPTKEEKLLAVIKKYKIGTTKAKQKKYVANALEIKKAKSIKGFVSGFKLSETDKEKVIEEIKQILFG